MFIAREKEVRLLQEQYNSEQASAMLVYGKRRVGKSTLILEAAKEFKGVVIYHMCVQSTYEGNLEMLSRSICQALSLPKLKFAGLQDIFSFLQSQNREILLVLDEYQYLKNSKKQKEIDSIMQGLIDRLSDKLKLVLCGSYISIMQELLEEDNPLFGRFQLIIHLREMDYYDAARFYPEAETERKIENYAVFGGSPYVLRCIDSSLALKDNIIRLVLPETGILRTYVENVILKEIQKNYDSRILEILGNGKKRYSDIANILGDHKGLLDKQLKNLMQMETISKTAPINKLNDKRKQFYQINDNLIRFYFSYIYGNAGTIKRIGEQTFYDQFVEKSIGEFVSRRFEEICRQYLQRQVQSGRMTGVYDTGTFWYDDPVNKTNGEFDCVLRKEDGYVIYECKHYKNRMSEAECQAEAAQVKRISGLKVSEMGFICSAGFDFSTDAWQLITGENIYE